MSTSEKVMNVLSEITQTDEVVKNPDIELFDLDILDSLATVELMIALEEAFGVELSPAEIDREDWATPGKIIAFMESRIGQ